LIYELKKKRSPTVSHKHASSRSLCFAEAR